MEVDINKYLEKIEDLKVLIIGETIIDEYQYGYTLGKAGKFPIVAFQNERKEVYPGGVKAIYRHLKDFCEVRYYTDKKAIRKKRYVQNGQKLFETYTNDRISEYDRFFAELKPNIKEYDLVIIADFGHGFIDKRMRDWIEDDAKYIALNTQSNAGNMGMNTINKYNGADYICIDHSELRLATSNQYGDLDDIIRKRFEDETVSITLSKDGTMVYRDKDIVKIKALADNIVDTVGAGDAYFAISSLFAYMDAPLEIIGYMGNIAGAIACTYQGNKENITKERLLKWKKEN